MLTNKKRNISNFVWEVEDFGQLNQIIERIDQSIFGIELSIYKGGVSRFLVTPPHIRLNNKRYMNNLEPFSDGFDWFEGYMSKRYFLPLSKSENGKFIDDLINIKDTLMENDEVYVQMLFRKDNSWKKNVADLYQSYLDGIEYPISLKMIRQVQEKSLDTLNKITTIESSNQYSEDVEEKILSQGFQFELRIAMKTEDKGDVWDYINNCLQQYDFHNSLRIEEIKPKYAIESFVDRVIDSQEQIISKEELFSLVSNDVVVKEEVVDTETNPPTNKPNDIVELLPDPPSTEVEVDPELEKNLAESLKRIKLIDSARLYNTEITAGSRLTILQCDIPKEKNFTHIQRKQKDIQVALGVNSLGIEQGEKAGTVKFSIPNEDPMLVSLRSLLEKEEYQKFAKDNPLSFPVGLTDMNEILCLSLVELVHLLIAGTTGSGKSVFMNSIVTSLLMNHTPDELNMILVDPKQVELPQFKDIPHVQDVITDMEKACEVFESLTVEMDERYEKFSEIGVRNITRYNEKSKGKMPYIVLVIDEYADMVMQDSNVEDYIIRLGQKARSAGIHIILATQRPDAETVTGKIKANIQNRISLSLGNNTDYKTVFSTGIPYKLLGNGDGCAKIESYPKDFQRFQSGIISLDGKEEEQFYEDLKEYYKGYEKAELVDVVKKKEEVNPIEILKEIIANTGETRIGELQKKMNIRNSSLQQLMSDLCEEEFLMKHKSKSKGYELIASEEELNKYIKEDE